MLGENLQYGRPIIPQTYLKRQRINNLLEKALLKPITTVVAGAGYGKTQAVYTFLHGYDASTIWLQLSASDNEITRLWENFIHAVSLQNDKLASKLKLLGFPETVAMHDRFMNILYNEMSRDKKYVLVYDDIQLIYKKDVLNFLEKFCDIRLPNLSVIFISRTEPDINILSPLSKDLVSYINEDDLRFSKNEMTEYYQLQNIQILSKTVADIYEYTHGWILAIHLVGLSIKRGAVNEKYALSAAKENIYRLLEKEVFASLPEKIKETLIKLSLVDNVPLGLFKELFPNNDALMREIAKISSFVRYDAFANTYRIHHLFYNLLTEKQSMLSEDEKINIFRKSAEWYAQNGYVVDAIIYFEKINEYDEIIKIILDYPTLLPKKTNAFMLEVLGRASKAIGDISFIPDILYTRFLIMQGKNDEALEILSKARKKCESMPLTDNRRTALSGIYLNMGFASLENSSNNFKDFFKMAFDTGEKLLKTDYVLPPFDYICIVTDPDQGTFDRFIADFTEATVYMSEVMHGTGYGCAELAEAEAAFFQNNIKKSEKYAYHAIYKAQQKKQYFIEYFSFFYLIRINVSKGNYVKAMDLLERLKSQVENQNLSPCYQLFDIISGWFFSAIEQFDKVANWIKGKSANTDKMFEGLEMLAQARYKFSEKNYIETLAILENIEETENMMRSKVLGRIEIAVLKAASLYRMEEIEEALSAFTSAYDLAYPNSLIMPFIEMGNHVRTLTKVALRSKKCSIPREWLEMIHTRSSSYAKRLAYIIENYKIQNNFQPDVDLGITRKELEVLKALCHGLTREEIADHCGISINTVKSMLEIIYTKLGAETNIDAIRIAISMKIVNSFE